MKMRRMLTVGALIFILLSALTVTAVHAAETVHTPSNEYLSSKYYAQLNSVELTGDERTDVVLVALSQLGYHEGNSDADMGGGNMSGTKNFVEYNRLHGKLYNEEGNGESYGYEWCCSFATWCVRTAGVSATRLKTEVSCHRLLTWCSEQGIYKARESRYTPRTGDLIFFKKANSGVSSTHIGIVLYADATSVYTIEGNTQESNISISGHYVSLKNYSLTDTYIVGYAVPNYAANSDKAIDFSEDNFGTHYITASSLNIRSSYTDTSTILGYLKHGELVNVTEIKGGWGKIKKGSIDGWISLSFAQYVPSEPYTVLYDVRGGTNAIPAQARAEGEKVNISETVPVHKDYKFAGWTTSTTNFNFPEYTVGESFEANGNVTLTAVWTTGSYTIKFYNQDELLYSGIYGSNAIVPQPKLPEKIVETIITHRFDGWDTDNDGKTDIKAGEKVIASDNMTLRAVYVQEITKYRIAFLDMKGNIISEKFYILGDKITAPAAEDVPDIYEGKYRYVFIGWDKNVSSVATGDAEYKAIYNQEDAKYKVTFVDGDGKTIRSDDYYYGETPVLPTETPTKTADKQYTYTFKEWDKKLSPVTGNVTYTATFTDNPIEYTITFIGRDGKVLETKKYKYADAPKLTDESAVNIPNDERYFYTFIGWSPVIAAVTEDATYTAQYSLTEREYIVTFFNYDGSVYKTQNYKYGESIVFPEAPAKEGYSFTGWTPETATVTGNLSLTPHFKANTLETTTESEAPEKPGAAADGNITVIIVIALVAVIIAAAGFVVFIIIKNGKSK